MVVTKLFGGHSSSLLRLMVNLMAPQRQLPVRFCGRSGMIFELVIFGQFGLVDQCG